VGQSLAPALLPRFDLVAPGHGYAELGGTWSQVQGWQVYGEAAQRWTRFDLGVRAWYAFKPRAAGAAVVGRW
jgi:hypothetical protein